jgi:hypothetical protein
MAIHILDQGEHLYALAHADDPPRLRLAEAHRNHARGPLRLWAIEAAGVTVYAPGKPEAKVRLREVAAAIQSRRAAP